jgi:anti-sigma factor RsiW
MNHQDRDLIAALAEGQLSTPDARDAVSRVEADPELAAEYADQVAAIQFLQSATVPEMTPSERSTLHANLTEQLGLVPAAASAPPPSKKKAQWWAPVLGLATAAVVVAAVVLFPGSTDDSFQEVSATLDVQSDSSSQSAEAPQPSTTAAAGAAESSPPVADQGLDAETEALLQDSEVSVYETDTVDLDTLLDQADGADDLDAVQRQLSPFGFTSTISLDSDEVASCINSLRAEVPDGVVEVLVLGADVGDAATTVHVGFDYGSGVEDGLSFDLETCELLAHSPQG